jgi:hypothetical protein
MFDAEYFSTTLPDQVRRMHGSASAELHLFSGTVYFIAVVEKVADGYVLLQVYSNDLRPRKEASREESPNEINIGDDRLAVSFESISHVLVTTAAPESNRTIGFGSAQ